MLAFLCVNGLAKVFKITTSIPAQASSSLSFPTAVVGFISSVVTLIKGQLTTGPLILMAASYVVSV